MGGHERNHLEGGWGAGKPHERSERRKVQKEILVDLLQ